MQFVEEQERSQRRWYGASVGHVAFDGHLNTGRSLRVFLSSTFRDMNEEREIFTKRYAAALRQVAKERGVSISFVDLRWGVTVEQATGGGVVDICLTNLQGSRYFVNFLGLRYPALSPN